MPKLPKVCLFCKKAYEVFPCFDKTSKYCSRLCHNRANAHNNSIKFKGPTHWNTGKDLSKIEKVSYSCKYCNTISICLPSEYKAGRRFCSINCHNQFQYSGGENSTKVWIRESIKLFGYNCQKCDESIKKIDVHHIDRNRKNNPLDGSNWMRLCDKCHKLIHKLMRDRAPIISKNEFLNEL